MIVKGIRTARVISVLAIVSILCSLIAGCGGGVPASGSTQALGAGGSGGGSGVIATSVYTLSWDAVNDPNVTGYRIYYATQPLANGVQSPIDLGTTPTSYDFDAGAHNLTQGSTLYMAVMSIGSNGMTSPLSQQVSVTVQ